MAMVHKNPLFWECDFNPDAIAWIKGDGVFPTLFIRRRGIAVPAQYLELDTVKMEGMNHAAHHVRCIVDFPHFCGSYLCPQIHSLHVKSFPINCHHVPHTTEGDYFIRVTRIIPFRNDI